MAEQRRSPQAPPEDPTRRRFLGYLLGRLRRRRGRGGHPVAAAAGEPLRPGRPAEPGRAAHVRPDRRTGQRGRHRLVRPAPDGGGPGHHDRGRHDDRRRARPADRQGAHHPRRRAARTAHEPAHRRLELGPQHLHPGPHRLRPGPPAAQAHRRGPVGRAGGRGDHERRRARAPQRPDRDVRVAREGRGQRPDRPGVRDAQGRDRLQGPRQAAEPDRRARHRHRPQALRPRPPGAGREAVHGAQATDDQRHRADRAQRGRRQGDARHHRRGRGQVRRRGARRDVRPVHRRPARARRRLEPRYGRGRVGRHRAGEAEAGAAPARGPRARRAVRGRRVHLRLRQQRAAGTGQRDRRRAVRPRRDLVDAEGADRRQAGHRRPAGTARGQGGRPRRARRRLVRQAPVPRRRRRGRGDLAEDGQAGQAVLDAHRRLPAGPHAPDVRVAGAGHAPARQRADLRAAARQLGDQLQPRPRRDDHVHRGLAADRGQLLVRPDDLPAHPVRALRLRRHHAAAQRGAAEVQHRQHAQHLLAQRGLRAGAGR